MRPPDAGVAFIPTGAGAPILNNSQPRTLAWGRVSRLARSHSSRAYVTKNGRGAPGIDHLGAFSLWTTSCARFGALKPIPARPQGCFLQGDKREHACRTILSGQCADSASRDAALRHGGTSFARREFSNASAEDHSKLHQ